MDPGESPISRAGRTLWTVWSYITGAVSRFLRPEATNTVSNDPSSFQESAVDDDPPEGETSGGGIDEEQPHPTTSPLSSSRPGVAWETCTSEIDLGPENECVRYRSQLSGGSDSKASEEVEDMKEEQLGQTGNDDAVLLIVQDARAKEDEEVEIGGQKLSTYMSETPQYYGCEERAKMASLHLTDDAVSEDMEGSGSTDGAATLDDSQKTAETMRDLHVMEEEDKMHHEDEQDVEAEDTEITLHRTMTNFSLEEEEEVRVQSDEAVTVVTHEEIENRDGVLQQDSENGNKRNEGAQQVENQFSVCEELSESGRDVSGDPGLASLDDELQMTLEKSINLPEDVGQEHVMAHGNESDEAEDEGEREDESKLDEREQGGEENVNDVADNQSVKVEDIKIVTEDSQEDDILTEQVTCNVEAVLYAEAELHTAEFTGGDEDEDEDDVAKDTKLQTKTRETDDFDGRVSDEKSHVTPTDIAVVERFFDKDHVEEERLFGEKEDNKESWNMETSCTATSFTVTPEGEIGQEISGEFKNNPPGPCEGWAVVLPELNSPTCEEAEEGLPEYNNEPGPDENTTQRFLEVGKGEEIQATQLPEEVETKEPESLQNTGAGGDYLLVREHMEEERESTEDFKTEQTGEPHFTVTGSSQDTEKLLVEPVTDGSGHLFEEEEGKLLDSSMKTGIRHSEKEFETHVYVTVEADDETTNKMGYGSEELLVEFERDEELSGSKDAAGDGCETTGAVVAEDSLAGFSKETLKMLEAEVQKMTEMSFFQELEDPLYSEQNSNKTHSLLEDITESESTKWLVETEPQLLEDRTVEIQDAGIDVEETVCGAEDEAVEDETQNKNEMEVLNLEEMAAELTTESNKDILIAESETAKHMTKSGESYAEETRSSVGAYQDVIDEDILDLWIQTASLKDTNATEQQEEPEPGHQMDTKPDEEQDELQSVQTEEELAESHSGESGLASDTEMSPSTAESGLLDKSVSEWGTDHSETQLLKSTSAGSFQGIYDMMASMSESADISELSTQQPDSEPQDVLMEEAADTGQSDLTEEESIAETSDMSSEAEHLSQESDESRENRDEGQGESLETETGSQKEIDADITDPAGRTDFKLTEEADVETLFKVEDEPLDITVSDSPDEIKRTESGQSTSGSEASLQEEIIMIESEDDACIESSELLKLPSLDEPQPGQSEDIAESVPEQNRAEAAEELTTKSEDQTEVDASTLDFTAQKSRIAVKNPHVRPPKDPRALLHMPSVDPTPSSRLPVRAPVGVPLGGMGIGIKLPGLGAGFPVLKKTQRVVREETSSETPSQEPEAKPEEKSDAPKPDEAQHKPKWMPPRHPGFGNPLMSELKTKLKKTTKD